MNKLLSSKGNKNTQSHKNNTLNYWPQGLKYTLLQL